MSHLESVGFFKAVAAANPTLVNNGSILEIGSYDVNGGIRSIFAKAKTYVGVDLCEGPGVDIVSTGHELAHRDCSYDIALSSECFEHNPHWRETFLNMVRMTRPGGLVVFSCASRGRVEHGTSRTDPAHSPGTQSRGLNYYRNLDEADFRSLDLLDMFGDFKFWYLSSHFDLMFVGIKKGSSTTPARMPTDDEVFALSDLMSGPYKVVTSPFRGLARIVPDEKYQSVAVPLSKALAPAIMFFEYRRNTNDFRWTAVLKGVAKRVRHRRVKLSA